MARKNDADAIAANYEKVIQSHRETAEEVVNQIQQALSAPNQGTMPADMREGLTRALAYARNLTQQAAADAKSGRAPEAKQQPVPTPEQAAEKAIAQEGQPTGKNSVFGTMFNSQQGLTTAGTMALAQALGSKYMIGVNNKVNTSGGKGLGALSAVVKPGLTTAQILTSLMFNQDQGTIQAIQRELVGAGYLDPLHTTNLQIGSLSTVNDPTLQALANMLEASGNHNQPVEKILQTGQQSRQGKDFANLWDSVVTGKPFTVQGQQTQVSSADALADSLRKSATGDNFGQGVLSGGAGRNPTQSENASFVQAAQQYQLEHPAQVTTEYEPQPGLGVSGFTRFPLQKSQTTTGGADQAAMDQFTYNWVLQNMGTDVAANGAANILSAFNQLIGLSGGTGSAPSSAAGGAA